MAELYVNSDWAGKAAGEIIVIDGVEYVFGTSAFANFKSAMNFIMGLGGYPQYTIVLEKSASLNSYDSNFAIDNTFDVYLKDSKKVDIIVKKDARLDLVCQKTDFTYDFIIEAGGRLETSRSAMREIHIKTGGRLMAGSADGERAIVNFMQKNSTTNGYDLLTTWGSGTAGIIDVVNTDFTVRDLAISSGSAKFTDSLVTIQGALTASSSTSFIDSTVNIWGKAGHSSKYFKDHNYLGSLTMTNSAMTIDDKAEATVANKVVLKSVTLNNSTITVESGTAVEVTGSVKLNAGSKLSVGSVTLTNAARLTVNYAAVFEFNAVGVVAGYSLTIDSTGLTDGTYKVLDYLGDETVTVDDYKFILGESNWADNYIVYGNDLYVTGQTADTLYVNSDWAGKVFGEDANGKLFGYNAFSSLDSALKAAVKNGGADIVLTDAAVSSDNLQKVVTKLHGASGMDFSITGNNAGNEFIAIEMRDDSKINPSEDYTELATLRIFDANLNSYKLAAYQNSKITVENSYINFHGDQNGPVYTKGNGEIYVKNSTIDNTVQISAMGAIMEFDNSTLNSGSAVQISGAMVFKNNSVYTLSSAKIYGNTGSLTIDGSTAVRKAYRTAADKANALVYFVNGAANIPTALTGYTYSIFIGGSQYSTTAHTGTGKMEVVNGSTFDFSSAYADANYSNVAGYENSQGLVGVGVGSTLTIAGSTFKTDLLINEGAITIDAASTLTAQTLNNTGTITIDAAAFAGGAKKVIDLSGTESLEGKVTISNLGEGVRVMYGADGDVTLSNADVTAIYVNDAWANEKTGADLGDGKYMGGNAFATVHKAIAAATAETSSIVVVAGEAALGKSVTTANPDGLVIDMGNNGVTVNVDSAIVDADGNYASVYSYITDGAAIGSGVTVNADIFFTVNMGQSAQIDGVVNVNGAGIQSGQVVIGESGELNVRDLVTLTASNSELVVEGKFTASEVHFHDSTFGSAFTVANGGVANVTDLILFTAGSELNVEEGGKLYVTNVAVESMNIAAGGEIAINADGVTVTTKMLDVDTIANAGTITVENLEDGMFTMTAADGDIWVVSNTIYVDANFTGYEFGEAIANAEGLYFGVNAFASLDTISAAASQGVRTIKYTADKSGALEIGISSVSGRTDYQIGGYSRYVRAGNTRTETLKVEADKEYTFVFTNEPADFELSYKTTAANAAKDFDVAETATGITIEANGSVAEAIGKQELSFTLDSVGDLNFTISISNEGKVEYTLLDAAGETVLHGYSSRAIRRWADNLAKGEYTLVVESMDGKTANFNVSGEVDYKVTGPSESTMVSDADDEIDDAFKMTSGTTAISNWVGNTDGIDYIDITAALKEGRNYLSIQVAGSAQATIWTRTNGELVELISWNVSDETDTRALRCTAGVEYFVSMKSDNDSNYTMQLS